MKIALHGYELVPRRGPARARAGALLKVEWSTGRVGFADLHPWPELGDEPLDEHLDALAGDELTELGERALYFARIDAELRAHNRNAFLGLALPRAHRLVTDLRQATAVEVRRWAGEGFGFVKVKLGRDLDFETKRLNELVRLAPLRWRLDFNGRISVAEFTHWWRQLPDLTRDAIDFVEDPCAGQLNMDGPWADDWASQDSARVRIVKPAREDVDEVGGYPRVVFTHALDHAFGRACAMWEAAMFYRSFPELTEPGGLADPECYAPDVFTAEWDNVGPRLKPTVGAGFGFGDVLRGLSWRTLR